ncbi:breast carcinoma amplified sequence 2 [Colletotrichum melonis]|uniref:Breast carcinoma amplified sequence 2 n=3 Tax=Colletotrichum acutatum species complex TaxID=2707335 RepID=A0AAJ0E391_9PEZI|nr:breast carcinoma amplified sequence 2 [Colletotrichum costaricense]KAI3532561.1 breast carcinoma amplified sequence 2 [Colletotrichum filicis]KAK0379570.1 breast carcinoma amplified sequence 2 [Colletotrichum limetticola]KAK1468912.1 breast carcinoma amplified sequence 2 [Colletotrichum melonis]KAK1530682.1 breast carcinoma amplified sequence 2 [Colletotrichum costaricense]
MSTLNAFHESLPYIDDEPTPAEREAAESLIRAELSTFSPAPTPNYKEPSFSPLVELELDRVASKQPLKAIDLERYQTQEPFPDSGAPSTAEDRVRLADSLQKAYISYAYLDTRAQNLNLLDKWGKNAWLIGNWGLENELKGFERDLAETKRLIDVLTVARRRQQEEVAAEMKGLEENWKKGVGRTLETEIAVEQLRREVLEEMRVRGG